MPKKNTKKGHKTKWKKRVENSWKYFKKEIYKYSISISSLILFLTFIIVVYLFFFYSAQNYPRGEEFPWFGTTIKTNEGIDLTCRGIYENYKEGYITMCVEFEKKEGSDNKIYLFSDDLPEESLEKSYLNLSEPEDKQIPMKDDERSSWYYFDLSESEDEDLNSDLRIFVGENFFPVKRERIVIRRYLGFRGFSKLRKNTNIEFLFPSEWNIISCPRKEDISIIEKGDHRIVSEAKNTQSVEYFIELERNYSKIALRDTKIGIFLTLLFAGFTLILSAYLYEKKEKN